MVIRLPVSIAALLLGFALSAQPTFADDVPKYVWEVEKEDGACISPIADRVAYACKPFSETFQHKGDAALIGNAIAACQRFYETIFTSLHQHCVFQGEAQRRETPALGRKVASGGTGQTGSMETHEAVFGVVDPFMNTWRTRFYEVRAQLVDPAAGAYISALQALGAKSLRIAELETDKCGVNSISPSVIWIGFTAGRIAEANEDWRVAANFLNKAWEDVSRTMDATRSQAATDQRNRVNETVLHGNGKPSSAGLPDGHDVINGTARGLADIAATTAADKAGHEIAKKIMQTGVRSLIATASTGTGLALVTDATLTLMHGHWRPIDTAIFGVRVISMGTGAVITVGTGGAAGPAVAHTIFWIEIGLLAFRQFVESIHTAKIKANSEKVLEQLKKNPLLSSAEVSALVHQSTAACGQNGVH